MVGATSALVSNLFFGQGPWTPWQMLAWGAVGAAGGLHRPRRPPAAPLGARRRRLPAGPGLRLVRHPVDVPRLHRRGPWPALVALYAQGLPFDLAHVAATGLFAGLFGVQAVTIVARFRVRTRVTFVGLEDSTMTRTSRPAVMLAFVLSAVMLLGVALPVAAFGARATRGHQGAGLHSTPTAGQRAGSSTRAPATARARRRGRSSPSSPVTENADGVERERQGPHRLPPVPQPRERRSLDRERARLLRQGRSSPTGRRSGTTPSS